MPGAPSAPSVKVWVAKLVDFLRAGALAAGAATLVGLWFHGMKLLGFRGPFPDGLGDFLLLTIAGSVIGASFGFATRTDRLVLHLGRVAGTTASGVLFAAAIGAFAFLLVGVFDVAERNLPAFFLVIGVALIAVGLRRVPRAPASRITLGAACAILLAMRLLALWPTGAHAITRRLFPLPESTVRAAFDREGCGERCGAGRTHVVSLDSNPSYSVDSSHLQSEAEVKATLEVDKPFFEDVCGEVYDRAPTVPASVRAYATLQACNDAHPRREPVFDTVPHFEPSPCCRFEVRERRPGERITTTRTLPFVFHAMEWKSLY